MVALEFPVELVFPVALGVSGCAGFQASWFFRWNCQSWSFRLSWFLRLSWLFRLRFVRLESVAVAGFSAELEFPLSWFFAELALRLSRFLRLIGFQVESPQVESIQAELGFRGSPGFPGWAAGLCWPGFSGRAALELADCSESNFHALLTASWVLASWLQQCGLSAISTSS